MASRTQTMVQLTDDLVRLLDRRAKADGVSRSRVIRDAVESYLAADRAAEIDRQIIAGYTERPQTGEFDADEWGDLDKMMVGLTIDHQRQLDADERADGFEPW